MAKKKTVGNGAGTVYPRRNKEGKITGYLGSYFDQAGKKRYVSAKHKNDCRAKLRKVMSDADQGIVFDAKNETVGAFLERWLRDVVEPNTAHRTYAAHRQQVRSHIIPSLGRVKLDALRKHHVDRLYADLLRPKSADGAGLAPSSARRVHAVLHAAMEEAVRGRGRVRHPRPKNASRREVGLPQRAVEALRRHAEGQADEIDEAGRALRAPGARRARPASRADRSTHRTSSTDTTSRSCGGPNYRPSASTTCATAACPYSPNAASPSATSRPSPGTRRRRSRCNATPTTTAHRPDAPPGRWTRPSTEPHC